ncbi:MAG: LPS-assembly protein LptD [Elusimicrobia bacterium]|nr:LPS-assembly protein LptD [Elusimicrobiota bacterium]
MRSWLLVVLLSASAQAKSTASVKDFALPEPPVADPVLYEADYFEYEGSTTGADAQMLLKGGVILKGSTWTLRGEEVRVDMETRKAKAKRGFEVDDGLTVLRGDHGEFDLADRSGWVGDVHAEYPPWKVWGRKGSLDNDGKGHFRSALFTSCDGFPPHYHFKSTSLHVTPRKHLTAYNVRFYVGSVPVFYTPFLWKSLKKKRLLRTRVIPGYDKRNGGSLRSNTLFNVNPALYGKIFVDGYTEQGLGLGSELEYHPSSESRGALYGYHVGEDETGRDRWTVLGSQYHAFSSSYAFQGRLQAQSDPEVNNNYLRSNAFRVTPELVNSAAVVRNTSFSTTRISYSRNDAAAPGGRFARFTESSPRLDWQTSPLSIKKVPVLFTLSSFVDNNYDRNRGFQQHSAGAGVNATKSLLLRRGMSFTPSAGFREVYEDRREALTTHASSNVLQDVYTGFYDLGTNLRLDSKVGAWDLNYGYTGRLKSDTMRHDVGAPDYGVERSLLSVTDAIRPDRRWLVRIGSGYDYRPSRVNALGFRDRVQPFTTDLTYFAPRGVQLSLRNDYQLARGNRAILFQGDWGERDGTFAAAGFSHTLDRADMYFIGTEGGWVPKGSKWGASGALRQQVRTPGGFDLRGYQLFEKELAITRDFHDFHTRTLIRFRPGGVKEFLFRIDLKTGRLPERRVERKDWEKEWFPWRGKNQSDDQE